MVTVPIKIRTKILQAQVPTNPDCRKWKVYQLGLNKEFRISPTKAAQSSCCHTTQWPTSESCRKTHEAEKWKQVALPLASYRMKQWMYEEQIKEKVDLILMERESYQSFEGKGAFNPFFHSCLPCESVNRWLPLLMPATKSHSLSYINSLVKWISKISRIWLTSS